MVIYGDILFLVNLYVDYFLLLGVKQFLHLRVKGFRLLLASLLGGAFSLLSLLPIPAPFTYVLSALMAVGITFAAFFPMEKLALIKASACFFAFSFIFGGIVLLLSELTGRAAVIGGSVYFDLSPLLLFLFTVLSYFVSLLLDKLRGGREPDLLFCKLVVEHEGKQVELFAKTDTGNTLKEPFSGLPVVVAEKQALGMFSKNNPQGFRLVPFHALGGEGLLPAFKPEKLYIKKTGRALNCYLALYDGKLSPGSWNCLAGPEAIETLQQGGTYETLGKT